MDINVAKTLFDAIDATLQTTLVTGTAKVMLGIGALVGTMWLIHFTLRSVQWLYQGMTMAFKDVVFEIAKMAFIAGCAFNVGWFSQTIVPFVTGLPDWMGGVLSGQEGNQINQIDAMIKAFLTQLLAIIDSMKFKITELGVTLTAVISLIFYIVGAVSFLLVAVTTTLVLKIATTVLLALGPVFICLALFDQTKQWFWGWVSQISGFMLTQVMFAVVLALEIAFVNTHIIQNGKIDLSLPNTLAMLVYFTTFTVLATELPNYAASIMGAGSSGSGGGLGGALKKASGLGAAQRLGGAVGKRIAKRFGNKMS